MSYVYIQSEPRLWTVGFYRPDGGWEPESDHGSPAEAAQRVARLNGEGIGPVDPVAEVERLRKALEGIAAAASEAATDFSAIGETGAATFARSVAKVTNAALNA